MLATLETFVRRVWVERDETAIDELVVADTRTHGLGLQTLVGPDDFKAFHRGVCTLLSDTALVVDHHLEADGWLAVLCTFTGTTAAGQRIAINGAIHARIADGTIREAYNHFDFIGLFMQMGMLPPNTFQRCMTGEPVGLDQQVAG